MPSPLLADAQVTLCAELPSASGVLARESTSCAVIFDQVFAHVVRLYPGLFLALGVQVHLIDTCVGCHIQATAPKSASFPELLQVETRAFVRWLHIIADATRNCRLGLDCCFHIVPQSLWHNTVANCLPWLDPAGGTILSCTIFSSSGCS